MKKAILFGASGFIGSCLLDELLNDPYYEHVTIVVRKEMGVARPNLTELIGDYLSLPSLKDKLIGDDVFIALGSNRKNSQDKREYYQANHDYPVLATEIAKENGANSVFIVTAFGADVNSSYFYIRTKGEVERDIIALGLKRVHIFRPSILGIHGKEVAKAMVRAAKTATENVRTYYWKDMTD